MSDVLSSKDVMSPQDMVEEAIAENTALRAEHARFRDALIDIVSGCHSLIEAQQKAERALDGSAHEAPSEHPALAAADVLAHQYMFSPAHERYWQARGGHGECTVCYPLPEKTGLEVTDADRAEMREILKSGVTRGDEHAKG